MEIPRASNEALFLLEASVFYNYHSQMPMSGIIVEHKPYSYLLSFPSNVPVSIPAQIIFSRGSF